MDLCTLWFFGWSQTQSSPTVAGPSFSQFLLLPYVIWAVRLAFLLVKTEAIKSVSTAAFHVLGNQVSHFLPEKVQFCPSLLFTSNIHIKAFLVMNSPVNYKQDKIIMMSVHW